MSRRSRFYKLFWRLDISWKPWKYTTHPANFCTPVFLSFDYILRMFTFTDEICKTEARWSSQMKHRPGGNSGAVVSRWAWSNLLTSVDLDWTFQVHWRNKTEIYIRLLNFGNCFVFYIISSKLSETTEFLRWKTEGICL